MSSRDSRLRNNNAATESQYQGFASQRIYANVRINGKSPIKFMVDTHTQCLLSRMLVYLII
jgi:hypothetical protein